ncbi:hypothetical protein A9F13_01g01232 [Clavispora lusitaniae]|uniref:NDT80 domain-containing protein n=1 Tax=Clavispora lusitaniae TaxID=36911 RepID=A0AA91Q3T9_CLALS|nr:hypothetical protein A9F13_01g01232 [Clavispora lusitaniae]
MSNKEPMDDLASLFLNNPLQPVGDEPNSEDFSFGGRSGVPTPTSMGMSNVLNEYSQLPGWPSEPGFPYGPSGYGNFNGPPMGQPRPFDQGLGHTSHYAEFIAPEANLFQRPMYPVSAFSPPMAQLDTVWHQTDRGFKRDGMKENPKDEKESAKDFLNEGTKESVVEGTKEGSRARKKRDRPKEARRIAAAAAAASIDYSSEAVLRLLDLKPDLDIKQTNAPVLSGYLQGRLFTNDQDNWNYLTVSEGAPDTGRQYEPQMVACYRRNYITIHLRVAAKVGRYRLEVSACTVGNESRPVQFLIASSKGDSMRTGVAEESISGSHVFSSDGNERLFVVKKFQFKSATANNTNLNFQTYYRMRVQLYGEDPTGPPLASVSSCPIIVRGRNPSFYEDRCDILVGTRMSTARRSRESEDPLEEVPEHNQAKNPGEESGENGIRNVADPVKNEKFEEKIGEKDSGAPVAIVDTKNFNEKEFSNTNGGIIDESNSPKFGSPEGNQNSDSSPASESDSEPPQSGTVGEALSGKSGRYHYFPISNVYYMPPINVVYFPHGAHQAQSDRTVAPQSVDSERRSSRVYFR